MKESVAYAELEEAMQSIDWQAAWYDPLYDTIEALIKYEKSEFRKIEDLLEGMAEHCHSGTEGRQAARELIATYWAGASMLEQSEYVFNDLLLTTKKLSAMNEKNYDYLANQLKYTGFGEELQQQLKEKMSKQEPSFALTMQKDYGRDETVATLQFRKSDGSDMYFFNRYSLALKNEQHPNVIKQTFYIGNKEDNITLKESYNLLCGRAVLKDLVNKKDESYKAWIQLDFKDSDTAGNFKVKQYHENYNYDLAGTLAKHPIKELDNDIDRQRLMDSLERGNRQSITMTIQGNDRKLMVEAVPQFKALNFYELTGQRIRTEKLYENNSQEQGMKEEKTQSQKQAGPDDEEGPGNAKKKSWKNKKNVH